MNKQTFFMKVAKLTAELSTCVSKQVGCVFVKDNRIIISSYNGVGSGKQHCNCIFNKDFNREEHHQWSKKNELHAEQNGISYAAKKGISLENASVFVTISPCIDCAKQLLASGISHVFYDNEYDFDKSGIDFLKEHNVYVCKLNVVD